MKKILGALLLTVAALFSGCEREFDEPLLQEPIYDGPEANMTIAEFREMFDHVGTTPELITVDYIIKGVITANDVTGNVYKQLFIEDETGGLCLSVDQTNMYASHRVGQEVYIDLHGLYALKYANALQVGYLNDASSNRVPWEIFLEHEHFNGFPDASRVTPRLLEISQLNSYDPDEILHTLVRFDNVHFQNGGVNPYSSTTQSTSEPLLDAAGNAIDVRTSAYATFVAETLPIGEGSVIGVLGLYNTTWQLTLRSLDDVLNFPDDQGGEPGEGGEEGDEKTVYYESFGTGDHSTDRPYIANFTGWDEPDVTYTDAYGAVTIRSTSNLPPHAWFPAGRDAALTATGINTAGYEDLKLTFKLAGSLPDEGGTFNFTDLMTVWVNDSQVAFTGTTMTVNATNTFYNFEVTTAIPSQTGLKLEFFAPATGNTIGVRLDDIKITGVGQGDGNGHGGDGGGGVTPSPGDWTRFFYETFGNGDYPSGNRPKIAEFTDFDMTDVTYSDASGYTDIRSSTSMSAHCWLPAVATAPVSYLTISNIDTSAYGELKLSFDVAGNTYGLTGESVLSDMFTVSCNDSPLTIPTVSVTDADQNFKSVEITTGLISGTSVKIEFATTSQNTIGLRLDNIGISGK